MLEYVYRKPYSIALFYSIFINVLNVKILQLVCIGCHNLRIHAQIQRRVIKSFKKLSIKITRLLIYMPAFVRTICIGIENYSSLH